jgi:DNA-binding SARP family transcriptional activator/TolB-like protein
VSGLAQRQAEAVVALLALSGELGCSRDRLVGLLWPESDDAHARHRLRNVLHAIRTAMSADAVLANGEMLRLNPLVVDVDVQEFSHALAAGRAPQAVAQYRGPLLDGFHVDHAPEFELWLEEERARLFRECAETLEALAREAEASGDWRTACTFWQRASEHDPHNSHLVLQVMRALVATGDRANALLKAEAHRRRLRHALELEPDEAFEVEAARLETANSMVVVDVAHLSHRALDRRSPSVAWSADADGQRAGDRATQGPEVQAPVPPVSANRGRWRMVLPALGGAVVLAGIAAGIHRQSVPDRNGAAAARQFRASVAILPCKSGVAGSGYAVDVATALHDELLVQLSKVAALRTISRNSLREFERTTPPDAMKIAAAWGVSSVVECRVQLLRDSLEVHVQLTDVTTGRRVWTQRYDRTLADAFAVESDIAQQIAAAVGVALSADEKRALLDVPTANPEAYMLYLRGHEFFTRPGHLERNYKMAQLFYERALVLDSSFALAHAALSEVHGRMFHDRFDPSPGRRESQLREAEIARRLAPDLPQTHLALGLVDYFVSRKHHEALAEFNRARGGMPNDVSLLIYAGLAHRRLGNWELVVRLLDESRRLDPRNAELCYDLGGHTFYLMHRYAEAVQMFDCAYRLSAGRHASADVNRGLSFAAWTGQLDSLRAILRRYDADEAVGPHGTIRAFRLLLAYWERRGDAMLTLLSTQPQPDRVLQGSEFVRPAALYAAWAHELRGESAAAGASFREALTVMDSMARDLPEDWRVHAGRGVVAASLGRREDALAEVRWIEQSSVYRTDAFWRPLAAAERAQILMRLGDADAALEEIERLLAAPSWESANTLRLDPRWDRIRADPRFSALLRRYAVR